MTISLILRDPHLSITKLDAIDLPDFTVLTGANGSGKSHFIDAIYRGNITVVDNTDQNTLTNFQLYQSGSLFPNSSTDDSIYHFRAGIYSTIQRHWEDSARHSRNQTYQSSGNTMSHKDIFLLAMERDGFNRKIVKMIESRTGKEIHTLSEEELSLESLLLNKNRDPFNSSMSSAFIYYYQAKEENDLLQFRSKKYSGVRFLEDREFSERFGPPPWETANSVLTELGMPYKFAITDPPSSSGLSRSTPKISFLNDDDVEISTGMLSSGEKTILALVNSIYLYRQWGTQISFYSMLLLDEIDALLHPSMVKTLINVLYNIITQQLGIKVILVTHSPTTVALSPEESIYVMRRKLNPRIAKLSRDAAIHQLLVGIPTLAVKFENRRQVFIESFHDATFYDTIYRLIRQNSSSNVSLNFIDSGVRVKSKTGNCETVIATVTSLAQAGNSNVYGVIDRDEANQPSGDGRILVMGGGERYAIENFILDPFAIGYLLFKEHWVNPEDLGLPNHTRLQNLMTANSALARQVVNGTVKILQAPPDANMTLVECKYENSISVNIPHWYLNTRGHDLEDMWIARIGPFNRFRNNEPKLKGEIIRNVFPDIPEFISSKFNELFHSLEGETDIPDIHN